MRALTGNRNLKVLILQTWTQWGIDMLEEQSLGFMWFEIASGSFMDPPGMIVPKKMKGCFACRQCPAS